MKIYISGKITGIEKEAPALFIEGAIQVHEMGHTPVNPQELPHDHDKTWQSYMREDIKALCDCDGIYMLKNWRNSKGARVEFLVAQMLGLTITYQSRIKKYA